MEEIVIFSPVAASVGSTGAPEFNSYRNGDIAVTSTAGATLLRRPQDNAPDTVRLLNTGATPVRVQFGASTVTVADTTGLVLPAAMNAAESFRLNGATHIACKTVSGTSTVNFQMGGGL